MTEEIERPLAYIRDKSKEYAEAKSNRVYLEQYRKSKKAILMAEAEESGVKTIGAQEVYAYSHPEYLEVLTGLKEAVCREEELAFKLKAAMLKIEMWRTKEASSRAERKAYGA
jgi:hypothetical protein